MKTWSLCVHSATGRMRATTHTCFDQMLLRRASCSRAAAHCTAHFWTEGPSGTWVRGIFGNFKGFGPILLYSFHQCGLHFLLLAVGEEIMSTHPWVRSLRADRWCVVVVLLSNAMGDVTLLHGRLSSPMGPQVAGNVRPEGALAHVILDNWKPCACRRMLHGHGATVGPARRHACASEWARCKAHVASHSCLQSLVLLHYLLTLVARSRLRFCVNEQQSIPTQWIRLDFHLNPRMNWRCTHSHPPTTSLTSDLRETSEQTNMFHFKFGSQVTLNHRHLNDSAWGPSRSITVL